MNIHYSMTFENESQLEMNHRLLKERFMSENEIVTHFEVDFGNEPEPLRFIDMDGNETVRYVQKRITIGNETVLEFADENENENQFQNENETGNELRFGNETGFENENRTGNENELENENQTQIENETLNQIQNFLEKRKKTKEEQEEFWQWFKQEHGITHPIIEETLQKTQWQSIPSRNTANIIGYDVPSIPVATETKPAKEITTDINLGILDRIRESLRKHHFRFF